MLQDRFASMAGGGGASAGALGFAAPGWSVVDQAQAAFAGIPSAAMSYASDARPIIGEVPPPAAAPIYDTTVWASGFGGERHQRADGLVLPTDDSAYGGAMGVDRIVNANLRLGVFVGAGAGREDVELGVQTIDSTYVFGGGYGRFDWATQYLDFALYGGRQQHGLERIGNRKCQLVRYAGGLLDGYNESGSEEDLSVGRRAINDL